MTQFALQPRRLITLTTDFGLQDGFVGAMHGVIYARCEDARIVDITHHIPAQNVLAAQFLLQAHAKSFPPGSVHVAVVDPGVGTRRRVLLAHDEHYFYIAPDNGLLDFLDPQTSRIFWLQTPAEIRAGHSTTFHGRDIFAPLAAHLAAGSLPEGVLASLRTPICRLAEKPALTRSDGTIRGSILWCDHFGNLISNIAAADLAGWQENYSVSLGDVNIGPPRETYASCRRGKPLALINSFDFLEIAVNQGSAAAKFSEWQSMPVIICRQPPQQKG